ncbi:fimbria/pilus outer membrane usher protein [Ectopseudomonas mendocina]|uniref:Fimbria/pilus outer membrane usher protein n=1 Tax=Ectopseudomonas mendocina TaxID=300 RepID=A0ABZ2RNF4_ECTME
MNKAKAIINSRAKISYILAISTTPAFLSPTNAHSIEFNQSFIKNGSATAIELKYFETESGVAPGSYNVDILINNTVWKRDDLVFKEQTSGKVLPEFNIATLREMGVDIYRLKSDGYISSELTDDSIFDLETIPSAVISFDVNKLELSISVPQIYILRTSTTVDPSLWEDGITAFYSNYQSNFTRNTNANNSNDYLFIGLRNGLNIGAWRLRNESTITATSDTSAKFNSTRNYIERDISRLKSTLSLGELYSPGNIFDSVQYRGLQLGTDTSMLAANEIGFAPTVHGIANSNATVEIRQNNNLIYSTSVPPGAFEITDIYPSGSNGDLEVTIIESDGEKRSFIQPYAFLPVMVSKGQKRYSLAMGEYGNGDYSAPNFAQGTFVYGLSNEITAYGGTITAEDYNAINVGLGLNTPIGGMSLDVTNSNSKTPSDKKNGQSVRFLYSKTFNSTDTTFTMVGYRYSTEEYRTLSQHVEDMGDFASASYAKQKNRLDLNINQSLGDSGTFFVSAGETSYWNTLGRTRKFQAGYSGRLFDGNFSISLSRTESADSSQAEDNQISATFSMPLGSSNRSPRIYTSAISSKNSGDNFQTGISGSVDDKGNLNYNAQATYNEDDNTSISLGLNWNSPYASLNGSYSQSPDSKHYNLGAAGSVVVHKHGITLGQPVSDTFALVEVPKVKGVGINLSSQAHTDSAGFVIANYVQPYRRNWIDLDTSTIGSDVELEETSIQVIPRRGSIAHARFNAETGRRVQFTLALTTGEGIPMGAVAVDQDGKNLGVIDNNSRLLAFGIKDTGKLTIKWQDEICEATYQLPEKTHDVFYDDIRVTCSN